MNVSPHFTLDEFVHSEIALRNGWDNSIPDSCISNIYRLSNLLECVRTVLNRPIIITSAYRSKQVNDAVGSKDTSQHRLGCAADIRVVGMTPDEVCRAIIASDIQYDQIIREFNSWTHISVPNTHGDMYRYSKLIIDKDGTRVFQ